MHINALQSCYFLLVWCVESFAGKSSLLLFYQSVLIKTSLRILWLSAMSFVTNADHTCNPLYPYVFWWFHTCICINASFIQIFIFHINHFISNDFDGHLGACDCLDYKIKENRWHNTIIIYKYFWRLFTEIMIVILDFTEFIYWDHDSHIVALHATELTQGSYKFSRRNHKKLD